MIERLSIRRRMWVAGTVAVLLSLPALLGVVVNLLNMMAAATEDETLCWMGNGTRLAPCGQDSGVYQIVVYGLQALAFAVPVVALLWVASWWAMRPVARWTAFVNDMGPQNLGQRLNPRGSSDPANELAGAIDRLMDRVANGYEAQGRFAANASHELRTPLAVQRTLIEVAMDEPEVAAHLAPLARQLLATNERNERLIEGLVALADSDRGLVGAAPVRLDRIVASVLESSAAMAKDAGVTLTLRETPTVVLGDEVLLERLVSNLVSNGLRYNVPGGRLQVDVSPQELVVVNTGPRVPPAAVPSLFEPFYRGGGERLEHRGGAGLGLAIVKSIVTAHGAVVQADAPAEGGLRVRVSELPTTEVAATGAQQALPRASGAETL